MNTLADVQKNDVFSKEFWEGRLLTMIKHEESEFLFGQFGIPIEIPANQGTRIISLRRYNSLPIRDFETDAIAGNESKERLFEGSPNAPLKIEAQKVQATVNQFGAWIAITDVVDKIHFDDIKKVYQPDLARHAAEVRERNTIAQIIQDSSVNYVGGKANAAALTATDVVTFKELRKVGLVLKINKRRGHAKTGGMPVALVHPNVMQDLMDDKDFSDRYMLAGQDNSPIKTGSLQGLKVYNMYIYETLISPVTTESNINYYNTFVLGKDAYAITSLKTAGLTWHETGFEAKKGDELGQTASIGYKMWHGAKTLDPIAVQRLVSRSAYDVAAELPANDPIGRPAAQ